MDNEVWRDIPGYEGRYQVSNYGRVLDVPNNKYLKEKVHQSRHIVILYGKKELLEEFRSTKKRGFWG